MILKDYHTHTKYSDGNNTPEEMVVAAIGLGLEEIGFSDHSYTSFETSWCIPKNNEFNYYDEIAHLKKKYADKIKVLCGIEQDYYSEKKPLGYDYIIGSVHFIKKEDVYIPIDESADVLLSCANEYYNGDIYALASDYYKIVGDVVNKTDANIIGHFDLISKFIEKSDVFDTANPKYIQAWQEAADKLLVYNIPFEINTGAISRGYRTSPYPSKEIYDYIKSKGGSFILSSDSHSDKTLCYKFEEYENWL